ncbi:hypothetical protein SADUNF_Sadunf05G0182400 [Salix dunnii]|uniref:Uncharacterized protein n=1 Tax=Salix dunnii TaxID=1413687 RepID=A0A835MZU7_9ROSI|nr:hypothetical protein SADUNF_Sadunf05G0182400 [Salix dunnii]
MLLGGSDFALFMDGISRGQECIRDVQIKGGKPEIDICYPSVSLMHFCPSPVSPVLICCSDKAMEQYGRGKKEACRIGEEKDVKGS